MNKQTIRHTAPECVNNHHENCISYFCDCGCHDDFTAFKDAYERAKQIAIEEGYLG